MKILSLFHILLNKACPQSPSSRVGEKHEEQQAIARKRLQACFEDIHKKRSHPKKLTLKSNSDEKKYSELAEKGSLSERSQIGNDLLACVGFKKEEKERKRKGVRISLCIHFCLLVIFSFFITFSNSQACSGRFVNPITDIC